MMRGDHHPVVSAMSSGDRAFDVHGNALLPLYRHGDRLIVSGTSAVKIGDRILLETRDGDVIAGTLTHRSNYEKCIYVGGSDRKEIVIANTDVTFMGRIVWASQ